MNTRINYYACRPACFHRLIKEMSSDTMSSKLRRGLSTFYNIIGFTFRYSRLHRDSSGQTLVKFLSMETVREARVLSSFLCAVEHKRRMLTAVKSSQVKSSQVKSSHRVGFRSFIGAEDLSRQPAVKLLLKTKYTWHGRHSLID
jgi:hypothetical protein